MATEDDVRQVLFVVRLPCGMIGLEIKIGVGSIGPAIGLKYYHKHVASVQEV